MRVIVSEYGADGHIGRTGSALRGAWGGKAQAAGRGPRNDGTPYLTALQALEAAARACADLVLGYCLFVLGYNSKAFWRCRLEGARLFRPPLRLGRLRALPGMHGAQAVMAEAGGPLQRTLAADLAQGLGQAAPDVAGVQMLQS